MHTLTYHLNELKATALVEETTVGAGRILAVVSIDEGEENRPPVRSHHTVVFELEAGKNINEVIEGIVRDLMHKHHLRKPAVIPESVSS